MPGRAEPAFWVRHLLVWSDVSLPPRRAVELRRGLNIVWSSATSVPGAAATGHAAGKTLFCRALRYCLGEATFADSDDTAAIRRAFPDGALGAEVQVRGEPWVVRRRFAGRGDDRAARGAELVALQDAPEGSFEEFREAIGAAALDEERRALCADLDGGAGWDFLLAWLIRDQECRLDGLTHWRHPESSSRSPVRGWDQATRMSLLRIAMGVYSRNSGRLRAEVEAASALRSHAEGAARSSEATFELWRTEVAAGLEVAPEQVWPPQSEPLETEDAARARHRKRLLGLVDAQLRRAGTLTIPAEHRRDLEEVARVDADLADVKHRLDKLSHALELDRQQEKLLTHDRAERYAELRRAKNPTCPFDDVPIDVPKAQFVCPLPRLPDRAPAERLAKQADAQLAACTAARNTKEVDVGALQKTFVALRGRSRTLEAKIRIHDAKAQALADERARPWATKDLIRKMFEARRVADEAAVREATAREQHQDLQGRRVESLKAYNTGALTRWFDLLVGRVVGPEATGHVKLDGDGLQPRIEWRGTRRSVALKSLTIVLFDVAAMLCAAEGHAWSPAFLVHDSPREGDLDAATYSRIFEAIIELGRDAANAPFQYIVTTTTDPPELARSHVRLELGADTDGRRFYGVDL